MPSQWSVIVGEMFYDLRSALDHAVYELTVLENGFPLDGTEFPVFDDERVFFERQRNGNPTRRSGLYKIRGLRQQTQECIESLQPFRTRTSGTALPLTSLLHELNIIDKHREHHLCRRLYTGFKMTIVRDPPQFTSYSQIVGGNLNERTILCRWTRVGFLPEEVDMEAEMPFDIAFDERSAGAFTEPQSVTLISKQIIEGVKNILVLLQGSL